MPEPRPETVQHAAQPAISQAASAESTATAEKQTPPVTVDNSSHEDTRRPRRPASGTDPSKSRIAKFRDSDFIKATEIVATLGVLAGIALFFRDMADRQLERVARSWQLLTTSAPGNSGKVEALEYLNEEDLCFPTWTRVRWCWKQRVPLRGIDLSSNSPNRGPVDLTGVNLSRADLRNANLSFAILEGANFRGATMERANLSGSDLRHVDLTNAHADHADFTKARLDGGVLTGLHGEWTNFSNASLLDINATGADLAYSDFSDAWLFPELSSVTLDKANFSGAILRRTRIGHASLAGANFTNADATAAQFKEDDLSGAVFSSTNLSGSFLINDSGVSKAQFGTAWAWSDNSAHVMAGTDDCLLSDLNIYNPAFWDPQWTPQNNYLCVEQGMTTVKQITDCIFKRYRSVPPRVGIKPSDKARVQNSSSCR